jgi:hypothetical protein
MSLTVELVSEGGVRATSVSGWQGLLFPEMEKTLLCVGEHD